MKLAALIGEPATGKTTVAREFLKLLSPGRFLKKGLVEGTMHEAEKVFVLGRYESDDIFAGTDRLSMAAQPVVDAFLKQMAVDLSDWSVFFEGDRLTSGKFFASQLETSKLGVFVLEAPESAKTLRHGARGDRQTEKFLKSRKTKVERLKVVFPDHVVLENVDAADPRRHAETILQWCKSQ